MRNCRRHRGGLRAAKSIFGGARWLSAQRATEASLSFLTGEDRNDHIGTESAHKANIVAAEGTRQAALGTAKAAYDGTPATYAAYAAAVKAADVAHCRSILASAAVNGLDGPRQTLHDLIGVWA